MSAIRVNGRVFPAGRDVHVGRDPTCDVVVEHPKVSRRHGTVSMASGEWTFTDSSTNGTFHNGSRIETLRLDGATTLRLGSASDGAVVLIEPAAAEEHPAGSVTQAPPPVEQAPPAATQAPAASTQAPSPPHTAPDATAPLTQSAPAAEGTDLGKLSVVHEVRTDRLSIGRDPSSDIVLDDLRVSRRHAELIRGADGGHDLVDAGSHNGTFVNGRRVGRARLEALDVVSIGNHIFRYRGGLLEEYIDTGEAWLEAAGLVVRIAEGRAILNGVGFSLEPSSLLGIVGPSGAGKSTLVNALTGFRPADEGAVAYGGRDVYASFEDLRARMGYVPQDDILHPQLTVRHALEYAAELRFPPDVDADARRVRVDEVMAELGLAERADVPIEKLSGGQRKRTSIGLELLTKPSLLFLDEPTSGLDPGNEAHVMELLRRLADGGRIVIVVTHSVQTLDVCDRVLYLAPGGTMAFFGPPGEALGYFGRFGHRSHAEIFRALDDQRDSDWSGAFASDSTHELYVRKALTLSAVRRARRGEQPLPPPPQQSWLRQFSVLVRRYAAVIRADRKNLILLAAQAPVFGVLDALLLPKESMSTRSGVQASLLIWLIVIGVTWLGMGNSIREIGKEAAIYRRERSVGLSISAYVASKVVLLGAITIVQAALLSFIALAKQDIPPLDELGVFPILGLPTPATGSMFGSMWLELMIVFALGGLAAMSVGLLLSALTRTVDRALSLLPLILIAQIVVSMPLIPQKGVLSHLGYGMTSKWANDAAASTVSLNELRLPYYAAVLAGSTLVFGSEQAKQASIKPFRSEWDHTSRAWGIDVAGVGGWFVIGVLGTYFVLRRRDRSVLGGAAARAAPAA